MIPLNAQVLHTPVVRQQDLTTDLHILPRIPNLANLMTLMRGSQKLNARIGPSVQRLNTQQSRPQKLNCRRWALSYPDLVALLAKEAPTLDPRLVEVKYLFSRNKVVLKGTKILLFVLDSSEGRSRSLLRGTSVDGSKNNRNCDLLPGGHNVSPPIRKRPVDNKDCPSLEPEVCNINPAQNSQLLDK
jgi:hypothetical protein